MFKDNQIVTANDIYAAGWQIDSYSHINKTSSWVSPDGEQCAVVYEGKEDSVVIEKNS